MRKQPMSVPTDAELTKLLASLDAPEPGTDLLPSLKAIPGEAGGIPQPQKWLRLRWQPITALGLLAVLALAAFYVSMPRAAFAQVKQALETIHTANWTETRVNYDMGGKVQNTSTSEVWVRRDPPAISRRSPNGFLHLIDERGAFSYYPPPQNRYSSARSGGWMVKSQVFSAITTPGQQGVQHRSDYDAGTRVLLDGRLAIQFRRESAYGVEPYRFKIRATLWADAATYRVIKVDRQQYYPGTDKLQFRMIATGYRYDQEPPEGTWDWSPPKDARVTAEDYSGGMGKKLSTKERAAIQAIIDRSDRGWNECDFATFASAWDLSGLDRFPLADHSGKRGANWKIRFENRKKSGVKQTLRSKVVSAMTQRYIVSLGSLPEGAPDILEVRTTSEAKWPDGTRHETTGLYYLVHTPKGYRIIHWLLQLPPNTTFDAKHRLPDFP